MNTSSETKAMVVLVWYTTSMEYDLSAVLLARHDTANRRLKVFKIVSGVFRHDLALHSFCFRAVPNVVQLTLQTTNPLFTVIDN